MSAFISSIIYLGIGFLEGKVYGSFALGKSYKVTYKNVEILIYGT